MKGNGTMEGNTLDKNLKGYQINIRYGEKSLLECMENVIRLLLVQSVNLHKDSGKSVV